MIGIKSWLDVMEKLRDQREGSTVLLAKGILPHPLAAGMQPSIGMPAGQRADFRLVLPGGEGLHVRDYGSHYEAHIDVVHPAVNLFEHLRQDAPGAFVVSGVALGAVIGRALGGDNDGMVLGGLLGGLLAAMAADDD